MWVCVTVRVSMRVRVRVRRVRLRGGGVPAVRHGRERDARPGAPGREREVGPTWCERVRRVRVQRVTARAARPNVAVRADATPNVEADALGLRNGGEHDWLATRDSALRVGADLGGAAGGAAGTGDATGAAVAEVLKRVGDDRGVDAGVHVAAAFGAARARVERRGRQLLRDVRHEPA